VRELADLQALGPEQELAQGPEQALVLEPALVQALAQVLALEQALALALGPVLLWYSQVSGWWRAQNPDTSTPARPPEWQPLRQSMFSRCCSWTHFPFRRAARADMWSQKVMKRCQALAKTQGGNAGTFQLKEKMARPTGIEPVFTT
jgi:hypothetical protein